MSQNIVLLTNLIGSLEQENYSVALTSGHYTQQGSIHVFDESLKSLVVLDPDSQCYFVNFFDSEADLTDEQMQSLFSSFPTDKPIKATLHVSCAYLIRHGTDRAEAILDNFKAVFESAEVVKTLDDSFVKGRVNL